VSAGAARALPPPGSARAWLLACRPATLTVAVVPVLIGTVIAWKLGGLRVGPALAALLGALLIQIGTNLANDVFDYEKGADGGDRLGPVRAAQAGLLTPGQMRAGMIVSFGLAVIAGIYLVSVAGAAIVIVGIASVASGIAYTGGPWPLGYNGLGDLFVFVFFGLVAVCCTAFVQLGAVPPLSIAAAVPIGSIATAVLVVNNVRDHTTDRRAGKRTLVVRFGRAFGVVEYRALLAIAYAAPVAIAAAGMSSLWVLLPWITAPLGLRLAGTLGREQGGPALNDCLARTAQLLLLFGLLLTIGLAL
jgi:1,4-dihydroxy-2-naphthoate polyprenyltransferase